MFFSRVLLGEWQPMELVASLELAISRSGEVVHHQNIAAILFTKLYFLIVDEVYLYIYIEL